MVTGCKVNKKSNNSICSTKQIGFTLVEVIVAISITLISLTIAMPSFIDLFDRNRLTTASEQLYSHLQQARMESVSRSDNITLNFSGAGTDWIYGYSQGTDPCDLTKTSPTEDGACILIINDGDDVIEGVDGGNDDGDKILNRFTSDDFTDIKISFSDFSNGNQITFDPLRGISDSGQINFTSAQGHAVSIKISALGMIKICDPNASSGYLVCS